MPKPLHAGRMNHRIAFKRQAAGQDDTGAPNGAWEEFYACSAFLDPLAGREWINGGVVHADVTHKIGLRYASELADATPADRVYYGSRVFNIVAIRNLDEANRWLELAVREIVA